MLNVFKLYIALILLVMLMAADQISLKGLVHPKMPVLSLITHPHVIPNP